MRAITVIAIVAVTVTIGGALLLVTPITSLIKPSSSTTNEELEIVMGGTTPSNTNSFKQVNVTINGATLVADVAETSDQKSKGLTVKDTLAENEGMLFVFEKPREHGFWMPSEMKFPIDIIWINERHKVVHVEHRLDPCEPDSFCPTYKPDRNSLYVLETVAGFAQKYNVTENTYVDFQLEE